jgi:hypothetical protein
LTIHPETLLTDKKASYVKSDKIFTENLPDPVSKCIGYETKSMIISFMVKAKQFDEASG